MHHVFKSLTTTERAIFKKYNTPQKIQTYLDSISVNFEQKGNTLQSPRRVLISQKAHCFEGALLGAAMLWYHGYSPVLLDLVTTSDDDSHVVVLFQDGKKWGALSKTNHAVLRYRDPVYISPRELVMSYFHEYFLDTGKKTLHSYAVFQLQKILKNWIVDTEDLWYIDQALDALRHTIIIAPSKRKKLRNAHAVEIEAGKLVIEKRPLV